MIQREYQHVKHMAYLIFFLKVKLGLDVQLQIWIQAMQLH
jgi:hypothetical protein